MSMPVSCKMRSAGDGAIASFSVARRVQQCAAAPGAPRDNGWVSRITGRA
jgi:hypothetical protein